MYIATAISGVHYKSITRMALSAPYRRSCHRMSDFTLPPLATDLPRKAGRLLVLQISMRPLITSVRIHISCEGRLGSYFYTRLSTDSGCLQRRSALRHTVKQQIPPMQHSVQ